MHCFERPKWWPIDVDDVGNDDSHDDHADDYDDYDYDDYADDHHDDVFLITMFSYCLLLRYQSNDDDFKAWTRCGVHIGGHLTL